MADLATQLHDDSNNYVNDANVEIAWAIKAAEYASVHMNLLTTVNTKDLELNKQQKLICARFRHYFPDMNVDETKLKGEAQPKWRQFCEEFTEIVSDFNFGTILRIDVKGIYNEANTVIVPKVIYFAIEGTRNLEGINEKYKPLYSALHKREKEINANIL